MGLQNWLENRTMTKIKKLNTLKIGLALSGGGTRGVAYIGVIKAFREAGIRFDFVAGTSAGSLLGAAYCNDMSVEEMTEIAKTLKTKDVLTNKLMFIPSKPEKFEAVIDKLLDNKSFEDLPIPLTVVAVDINTGDEIHIKSGKLAKPIVGSCAFPGIFSPVPYQDYRLVDGGLQNNIPADAVREMGADIVVSVDLNPNRGAGTDSDKYLEIMKASLRVLMKSNSINGYVNSDYVVKLDLSNFKQTKMEGIDEMIEFGYQTTKAEIPQILQALRQPCPNESIKDTLRRIKVLQKKIKAENQKTKK